MTDKKREGPQLVGELIPDVLALSRQLYEDRLARMVDRGVDLDQLVSETHALDERQKRYLLPLLPVDLRVREFLECTIDDHVVDATARLELCSQCPERGGLCRDEDQRQRGKKPFWDTNPKDTGFAWQPCERWRVYSIDRRMINQGFPSKLLSKTFDNYETETKELAEALSEVRGWCTNFKYFQTIGTGLLLAGTPGIGKTHLAVAACRSLVERRLVRDPVFWEYSHLMKVLRDHDDHSKEAVRQAMYCELLVLDDLNTERTTDWVREQLGMIINHRWSNDLLCIVTSNDNLGIYEKALGSRIVSRIDDMTTQIGWHGRDWRSTDKPNNES